MRKNIISIVTILLISVTLAVFLYGVQATGLGEINDNPNTTPNGEFIPIGNIIVGVVKAIGTALALLMLTIMGVKYIMGSVEEKATYKQTMIPYLIGAILIFSGAQITQIIYDAISKT